MRGIAAVALTTYREAIRNKTLYVLALYAVLVAFVAGALTQLSLHQERRVYLDGAAALIDLFAAFVAMGIGVNLVYKELQNKTVYLIVTKPISRGAFLAGKLVGQWAVMLVLVGAMTVVAMAGAWLVGCGGYENVLKQGILAAMETLLVSSVALLFSSITTPMLTGAMTLGVFVIGRFVPDMVALVKARYEAGWGRTAVEYIIDALPQFHLYAISGHEVQGRYVSIAADFVSWTYVGVVALYTVLYAGLIAWLAMALFRRRDLT